MAERAITPDPIAYAIYGCVRHDAMTGDEARWLTKGSLEAAARVRPLIAAEVVREEHERLREAISRLPREGVIDGELTYTHRGLVVRLDRVLALLGESTQGQASE